MNDKKPFGVRRAFVDRKEMCAGKDGIYALG